MRISIEIRPEPVRQGMELPKHQTPGASGMDLEAALPHGETVTIQPGKWALIPTGITLAIPPGYEGEVRSRSGNAAKHGVFVLNSPGTIDAKGRK